MSHDFASLEAGYLADSVKLAPLVSRQSEIAAAARRIIANRARYGIVEKATTTPWYAIGLLHMRESDFDFRTHLHNGDSLKARTVHVPKGRPLAPEPPYSWEASAIDAIRCDQLDKLADWSFAGVAFAAEKYNGFGPRDHGHRSGYLYAGSNLYDGGKYIADGKWDPDAHDDQLGVLVVLLELAHQCPDVADALKGEIAPLASPQPITIADAHASLSPTKDRLRTGWLAFGILPTLLAFKGAPFAAVFALIAAAAVGILIYLKVAVHRRLEHLQDAAAPLPISDEPPATDPSPVSSTAT